MKNPTVAHSTFTVERTYPKSAEKIFRFFSDPAKKRSWYGGEDEGFEILKFEPNFQVEGVERWEYRFKGGFPIETDVSYKDIVPNQRLVFVYTMRFEGKRVSSSQVTIELLAAETGTTLLHTEQGAFFDGSEQPGGREFGTKAMLERLVNLLE